MIASEYPALVLLLGPDQRGTAGNYGSRRKERNKT